MAFQRHAQQTVNPKHTNIAFAARCNYERLVFVMTHCLSVCFEAMLNRHERGSNKVLVSRQSKD